MRAKDFVTEAREGVFRLIKNMLPGWPEYVIRDMLVNRLNKGKNNFPATWKDEEAAKWGAVTPDYKFDQNKYQDAIHSAQEKKWAQSLVPYLKSFLSLYPIKQWRRETVTLNWDSWDPFTKEKLQGMLAKDPQDMASSIPRHIDRLDTQTKLLQQQGSIREPLILVKRPNGYELVEGHHRVLSLLRSGAGNQGFTAPAYVGYL